MPFREKARKIFKSKYHEDSLSKTSTNGSDRDRYPSNVYTPEEMPRPKYRAQPKKEHKEKLEAFSFSDAWRKRSFQSTHSPGGTQVSSRRNSVFSLGRKSRKSMADSESVRSNSVEKSAKEREDMGDPMSKTLTTQTEQEGDSDVANVGLSRIQSQDKGQPRMGDVTQPNGLHKTMSTAHDHQPFTEEDLAHAMHRSRLQVSAHS